MLSVQLRNAFVVGCVVVTVRCNSVHMGSNAAFLLCMFAVCCIAISPQKFTAPHYSLHLCVRTSVFLSYSFFISAKANDQVSVFA